MVHSLACVERRHRIRLIKRLSSELSEYKENRTRARHKSFVDGWTARSRLARCSFPPSVKNSAPKEQRRSEPTTVDIDTSNWVTVPLREALLNVRGQQMTSVESEQVYNNLVENDVEANQYTACRAKKLRRALKIGLLIVLLMLLIVTLVYSVKSVYDIRGSLLRTEAYIYTCITNPSSCKPPATNA